MPSKDTRKYNPNALSEYLERSSRFNMRRRGVGFRYPAFADTAIFPFILIVLGAIFGACALISLGSNFRWENLLSKSPTLVISIIFIIGGILKLRARRKRERHD